MQPTNHQRGSNARRNITEDQQDNRKRLVSSNESNRNETSDEEPKNPQVGFNTTNRPPSIIPNLNRNALGINSPILPLQDVPLIEDQEASIFNRRQMKIFSGSSEEWTDDRIREYQEHIEQTRILTG